MAKNKFLGRHSISARLTAGVLVVLFGFSGHAAYGADESRAGLDEQMAELKEAIVFIQANYKENLSYEQLIDGAYQGIFQKLDPFSVYYDTSVAMTEFVENTEGEYTGTGITFSMIDDECLIKEIAPGTTAEKAGIKVNNRIATINGKTVSGMNANEIMHLLRGDVGTTVRLGIQKTTDATIEEVTLTRESIKKESVNEKMLSDEIGYVQINNFDSDTDQELKKALDKLKSQGMTGLIIDLRDNGGGLVDSALKAAELVVPAGPLMYYEQQGKIVEEQDSKSEGLPGVLVAVLINDQTASAAEIFAGAVQDRQVGYLVGTTSYGKGTAQAVLPINEEKGMKLSMHYFLTPDKHKIHGIGLKPNYVVYNDLDKIRQKVRNFVPFDESNKPKAGDEGRNVYAAQERLALLGYDVPHNGVMDEKTVVAVKAFQAGNELAPYGTVDNITKSRLDDAVLLKCYFSDATMVDYQLNKAEVLVRK